MRREEVDVLAADVDGGLRNRSRVAQVFRTDGDEGILRKDQVTFRDAGRLGNKM